VLESVNIPWQYSELDGELYDYKACAHLRHMSAHHQGAIFGYELCEIHKRRPVLRLTRQYENLRLVILHMLMYVYQLVD
jgi:hypothetical protein